MSYLFIDGANLNAILKEIGRKYLKGHMPDLAWDNVRQGHQKVYYYDAVPVQTPGEDEIAYADRIRPKLEELKAIERQPSFHVRSGDAIHRKRRGGSEQKMVDVQLAVDALRMAHLGLFSHLTLLTSDLDFKPLVDALVDMGVQVTIMFPRGETNEALTLAADFADEISVERMKAWIDPRIKLPVFNQFVGNAPRTSGISIDSWSVGNDYCYLSAIGSDITLNINESVLQRHGNIHAWNANAALYYAVEHLGILVPETAFKAAADFDQSR